MWILLFLYLSYFCSVESSLAPFISKCKLGDSKCIKESAIAALPILAAGLPELNVESLDPLKIKRVNATKPGLEIIVKDIVVTGLKQCEMKKIKQDPVAENLTLKLECSCLAIGQYDMNGQLLFIPIKGQGALIAKIKQVVISADVNFTSNNIDNLGKPHWNIKTWKYDYDLKGKSEITFENLFPDNEILRKSTTELIANNGNDVIREMGTPLITAVVTKIVKNIANFMKAVPLEDLVLE